MNWQLFIVKAAKVTITLLTFVGTMSIEQAITEGILFQGCPPTSPNKGKKKQRTKAKKTAYVKGAHGSGAAAIKAEYRQRRANRKSK